MTLIWSYFKRRRSRHDSRFALLVILFIQCFVTSSDGYSITAAEKYTHTPSKLVTQASRTFKPPSNTSASTPLWPTVWSIAVHGESLFAAGKDHLIRQYSLTTGSLIRTLSGHTDEVWCIYAAKKYVYSGSRDGSVRQWNPMTGAMVQVIYTGGSPTLPAIPVFNLYVLEMHAKGDGDDIPEGDQVFLAGEDGTVKVWTPSPPVAPASRNSSTTTHNVRNFTGHSKEVWCLDSSVSGNTLYTGSADRSIREWDIQSGNQTRIFDQQPALVAALEVTPDFVFASLDDGQIKQIDLKSGDLKRTFLGHKGGVHALYAVDDYLLSGAADKRIVQWSMQTGKAVYAYDLHEGEVNEIIPLNQSHILSCSSDGTVKLWALEHPPHDSNDIFDEDSSSSGSQSVDDTEKRSNSLALTFHLLTAAGCVVVALTLIVFWVRYRRRNHPGKRVKSAKQTQSKSGDSQMVQVRSFPKSRYSFEEGASKDYLGDNGLAGPTFYSTHSKSKSRPGICDIFPDIDLGKGSDLILQSPVIHTFGSCPSEYFDRYAPSPSPQKHQYINSKASLPETGTESSYDSYTSMRENPSSTPGRYNASTVLSELLDEFGPSPEQESVLRRAETFY